MYKPIESYLPHRSPMVLLDHVTEIGDNWIICSVTVDKEGVLAPFLTEDAALPAWFLVEIMAQTIGVWNGHYEISAGSGAPRLGFLLGVRSFSVSVEQIPVGAVLHSTGKKVLQDDTIANFECSITLHDEVIAEGNLTVYAPSDIQIEAIFTKG